MKSVLAIGLASASLVGAVTHRALKWETHFKDEANAMIVGRMYDVENAVGTTWHSLSNQSSADLDPRAAEWEAAGIRNFRAYFNWNDAEQTKGQVVFPSTLDGLFGTLVGKKIKPYATLIRGNPLYHAGCCELDPKSGRLIVAHQFNPLKPEEDFFNPEAFAAFCYKFAYTYGKHLDYYEIGNEPYNFGFADYYGGHPSSGTVWGPRYAKYYNRAAERIREADPTAKFILGGVEDVALEAVKNYLPLVAKNVNAIAIHPYPDAAYEYQGPGPEGTYPYAIKPFTDLAAAYKIPEVWITEVGWTTPPPGQTSPNIEKQTSDIGQAKYLTRGLFFYPIRAKIKVYGQWTWSRQANNSYESGDIQLPAKLAYNFVHQTIKDSDPNASITPYKGTTAEFRFSDNADGAFSGKLEYYLLAHTAKKLFLVHWIRVNQEDGFPKKPVTLKLTFPKALSITGAFSHDILNQKTIPLSATAKGKELWIKNTWAGDYPNLIEIQLQ